ncbi:MAG: Gfo/Idh/MocA family oxidoreductase [Rhodobacteraceae bacterium]|nr:Gfo/Idh/MocA family oxidoreductase [Paracoccaceae bacterium]
MTIGWGLLGAGMIAERFAHDLAFSTEGRPAVVASRDLARATALANRIGGMEALDDYERLVSRDDVDAIYVATPNSLHSAHCLLAIAAGKPVLCEKPLATTAAEAREIAIAAQTAGVTCMEALWTRCLPLMSQVQAEIANGSLGRITQIQASLGFAWEEATGDPITDPALGGGALLDLGVYGLSLVHQLLGMPDSVTADLTTSATGSVRDAVILLRHDRDDGTVLSTVRASHSTVLPNSFEIQGTQGTLKIDAPFIVAESALIGTVSARRRSLADAPNPVMARLQNTRHWSTIKRGLRRIRGERGRTISEPYAGSGLQFEADAFARCLAGGQLECPSVPLDASIGVLEILDQVRAR